MASKQCPKCSGSMVEGYVIDRTHGGVAMESWVEGTPQRNIWTGLKLSGKAKIDVTTWRCGRCGFLEQYATGGQSQFDKQRLHTQRAALVIALVVAMVVAGIAAAMLAANL